MKYFSLKEFTIQLDYPLLITELMLFTEGNSLPKLTAWCLLTEFTVLENCPVLILK